MKKILLSLLLSLCVLALYAEGIGTSKELLEFASACNAGQSIDQWKNADGAVCLEADIDMSKVKKFGGIESFGGVFDGCGHAILNWKAQKGLFGEILAGGVVRNLRIDASCSMKAANKTEEYAVGFIADVNKSSVQGRKDFPDFPEVDVSYGIVVSLTRLLVQFDKPVVFREGYRNLCRIDINNKIFYRLAGTTHWLLTLLLKTTKGCRPDTALCSADRMKLRTRETTFSSYACSCANVSCVCV